MPVPDLPGEANTLQTPQQNERPSPRAFNLVPKLSGCSCSYCFADIPLYHILTAKGPANANKVYQSIKLLLCHLSSEMRIMQVQLHLNALALADINDCKLMQL